MDANNRQLLEYDTSPSFEQTTISAKNAKRTMILRTPSSRSRLLWKRWMTCFLVSPNSAINLVDAVVDAHSPAEGGEAAAVDADLREGGVGTVHGCSAFSRNYGSHVNSVRSLMVLMQVIVAQQAEQTLLQDFPQWSPSAEVEKKAQEVRAAKAHVKALKKEAKACRKELKKAKKQQKKQRKALDGEVTGHLDLQEKSVQKPGTSALKTWKVKNTGSKAWPEDTIAVFHNGNRSLVQSGYEVVPVGSVQPGDVQYIRCMLAIPEVEGTYSIVYRLSGPAGKFGGRLMTEIEVAVADEPAKKQTEEEILEEVYSQPQLFKKPVGKEIPTEIIDLVDEDEEESSTAQASEPDVKVAAPRDSQKRAPEKSFQFQKQKDQLKMMGFSTDDETIESVLIACKGDIGQAIELLM